MKATLYTSVFTLCLVYWFLHCFESVQCRSTRHLNEYSNRSNLTRRCLRSCFLVRKISILICKLKHFVLSHSGICVDKCKYRGGNVLCNEKFPQTLSCRPEICSLLPTSFPGPFPWLGGGAGKGPGIGQ